jgi:hypothetical protein
MSIVDPIGCNSPKISERGSNLTPFLHMGHHDDVEPQLELLLLEVEGGMISVFGGYFRDCSHLASGCCWSRCRSTENCFSSTALYIKLTAEAQIQVSMHMVGLIHCSLFTLQDLNH